MFCGSGEIVEQCKNLPNRSRSPDLPWCYFWNCLPSHNIWLCENKQRSIQVGRAEYSHAQPRTCHFPSHTRHHSDQIIFQTSPRGLDYVPFLCEQALSEMSNLNFSFQGRILTESPVARGKRAENPQNLNQATRTINCTNHKSRTQAKRG